MRPAVVHIHTFCAAHLSTLAAQFCCEHNDISEQVFFSFFYGENALLKSGHVVQAACYKPVNSPQRLLHCSASGLTFFSFTLQPFSEKQSTFINFLNSCHIKCAAEEIRILNCDQDHMQL